MTTQSPTMASQATAELPKLPEPRLLACPFCTGEGRETKEADSDWPSKCFMFIQCTRCGARTANVYGSGDPSEWADARHNWNQRLEAGRASRAQSEWQPIETAPKDGTHVLTWWAGAARVGWVQGAGQSRDGGDWWNTHERVAMAAGEARPTHWMPLPSAPATLGETK